MLQCSVCQQEIEDLQCVSGVDGMRGHHACVIRALPADRALQAVMRGEIAAIDPSILVDGRLPKFAERYAKKRARNAFESARGEVVAVSGAPSGPTDGGLT